METHARLKILREKRASVENLKRVRSEISVDLDQQLTKALEIEIAKRQQLSIEAKIMFADVKKLKVFGQAAPDELKMDFDFPKRAKIREILQSGMNMKLVSVDLCHKPRYEALFGIRLNFSNGVSSELVKTPHFATAEPITY